MTVWWFGLSSIDHGTYAEPAVRVAQKRAAPQLYVNVKNVGVELFSSRVARIPLQANYVENEHTNRRREHSPSL